MKGNFLGNAANNNGVVSIIPIPYEGTCSSLRGTADGPHAIIEASKNLELYDIELDKDINNIGIRTLEYIDPESTPEEMIDEIEAVVAKEILERRFPVIIGGCHTVTIGAIKALNKRYDDMSVLSLDAHADLKSEYDNTKLSHACVMARINEICRSVTVGVRSMSKDEAAKIKMNKNPVLFAKDIIGNDDLHQQVTDSLSKQVYITVDIDVFDPSIMASTGTPEPGGLLWDDVLILLKKVCTEKKIVGFDVVELRPRKEDISCDFLVAKLLYKLIGYSINK